MAKRKSRQIDNDEAKRWLRRFLIKQRQAMPISQQKKSSEKIINRLMRSAYFKKAKVVATYIGFGSEVLTQGLIQKCWKLKKTVVVPMTTQGFKRPFFALFKKGDALEKTSFGPLELKETKKPFNFSQIDLVIVPGLAFDSSGYRLGYGGGVYDRILDKTKKAKHVGLFFAQQQLHRVPRNRFDLPMAAVITEA